SEHAAHCPTSTSAPSSTPADPAAASLDRCHRPRHQYCELFPAQLMDRRVLISGNEGGESRTRKILTASDPWGRLARIWFLFLAREILTDDGNSSETSRRSHRGGAEHAAVWGGAQPSGDHRRRRRNRHRRSGRRPGL